MSDLRSINWTKLQGPSGSARKVPEYLRALASNDVEVRRNGFQGLYADIWHQGTVYEVTPHVVPFLIELLEDPETQDKATILNLLTVLSCGSYYWDVHDHYPIIQQEREHPGLSPDPAGYDRRWNNHFDPTREAIWKGSPIYRALVSAPDPALRVHASCLLARCGINDAETGDCLREQALVESDLQVKASLLVCLGWMAPSDAEASWFCESVLEEAEDPLTRFGAAIGVTQLRRESAPSGAIAVFSAITSNPQLIANDWRQLPWMHEGSTLGEACFYWRFFGARALSVLPVLSQAMVEAPYIPDALNAFDSGLRVAFAEAPERSSVQWDELSADQQQFLQSAAQAPSLWPNITSRFSFGETSELLRRCGLPDSWEGLRVFVGLAPRPDATWLSNCEHVEKKRGVSKFRNSRAS